MYSLGTLPAYAWFRFVLGYAEVPLTTALKADPVGTFVAAWPWVAVAFGLGLLGVVGLWRLRRVPGAADLMPACDRLVLPILNHDSLEIVLQHVLLFTMYCFSLCI